MANLVITNTFVAGAKIKASEHNTNWSDVRTWLNNRDNASDSWLNVKCSGIITGSAGTVGAPSLTLSDATTGFYRSGVDEVSVANAGVKTALFSASGTADDVVYNPFVIFSGSGGNGAGTTKYTTTTITTAKKIGSSSNDGAMALVIGRDGSGNNFLDLLLVGNNAVTPTVVSSKSLLGSPSARTYSAVSGQILLAMASGTYSTSYLGIGINFR